MTTARVQTCKCGKPFPPKRPAPKTGLCRNCWSIKGLTRKGAPNGN